MSDAPSGNAGSVSLSRSVKVGVAWSTLSFALTKLISFGALLVLTRLLAPSEFGVVAAISIVLGFIEVTTDLGMAATVIYEQGHGIDERIQTAFTLNLVFTVVLTAAAVLFAPVIAGFFNASAHTDLFRLGALDILLTGLGNVHDGLLVRDMRFNARIVTQVVGAVARAGVGIALALLGLGAASLVWGYIAGSAVWCVALWGITGFVPSFTVKRAAVRPMVSYGFGATMLEVVAQLFVYADSLVVGRVLGPRALGLYSVAFRVPSMLLDNIAAQISLVAFPALARKRLTDAKGVGAATTRLIRAEALYALPLAAGMAVLAEPIVTTLFSEKWRDAAGVFAAMSVTSGIAASAFALGDAFKALGRQRVMVIINLIQLPVLVGLVILVAPEGITAVAWARAGTAAIWFLIMASTARRVVSLPLGDTLGAMAPGILVGVTVAMAAGAVRLWSGLPDVPEILAAALAGALAGLAVLALVAPRYFRGVKAAGSRVWRTAERIRSVGNRVADPIA